MTTLPRLTALPLLALLTSFPAAFAQTPAPSEPAPTPITADAVPTFKVESNLVAVSAIVHDAAGKPISGLTRDDFTLKQDGKQLPITYFSQTSDSQNSSVSSTQNAGLPLTLALMVDTSGSQYRYIPDEIAAGRIFFPAMLTRPDDRAVLVQFDTTILQLAKMTTNVTTLEHALAYLTQPHDDLAGPRGHGGTLLYDAIVAVSHLELGNQLGRRAMVILTDGGDNGSRFNVKHAIEEAQHADIMVYTIYYSDGGGDENVLKDISRQTGGREFSVSPTMSLQQIYATISTDLRQEYELGYRPPDSRPNRYHKITLTVKDKSLTVQSRDGYFTPKQ